VDSPKSLSREWIAATTHLTLCPKLLTKSSNLKFGIVRGKIITVCLVLGKPDVMTY